VSGIVSIYKSKQASRFEKLAGCLILGLCSAMLIIQIFIEVWRFQLARGF
jgi:hypothetical protein